ncbi:unnamed protein product, partial [Hapterophycus canaliculatus]
NTNRVRVYDWPLPQDMPACFELPVHSGPVTAMVVTPDDNFIFTCGEDGSVFVLGIKSARERERERERESWGTTVQFLGDGR